MILRFQLYGQPPYHWAQLSNLKFEMKSIQQFTLSLGFDPSSTLNNPSSHPFRVTESAGAYHRVSHTYIPFVLDKMFSTKHKVYHKLIN